MVIVTFTRLEAQTIPLHIDGTYMGDRTQKVEGVCGLSPDGVVVRCDMHNGLRQWRVTAITFSIATTEDAPGKAKANMYKQDVTIDPLQTQTVIIRLGMRLPKNHWAWHMAGADGTCVDPEGCQ